MLLLALIVIPVVYFNASQKPVKIVEQKALIQNQDWFYLLNRSTVLREQKLYKKSKELLEKGIEEAVKENVPLDRLLVFTVGYIGNLNDSWPDLEARKENFKFSKQLIDSLKIPYKTILKSKKKNTEQIYLRNMLAMNYFYLAKLAGDAQFSDQYFSLLKKADEIYTESTNDLWLRIKIDTYLGAAMTGEDSYKILKRAQSNLLKLHRLEPSVMRNSTTPPRIYKELAIVCNKLGRHAEAARYANIGLRFRNKSVIDFDKNYIETMKAELKKANDNR